MTWVARSRRSSCRGHVTEKSIGLQVRMLANAVEGYLNSTSITTELGVDSRLFLALLLQLATKTNATGNTIGRLILALDMGTLKPLAYTSPATPRKPAFKRRRLSHTPDAGYQPSRALTDNSNVAPTPNGPALSAPAKFSCTTCHRALSTAIRPGVAGPSTCSRYVVRALAATRVLNKTTDAPP